MIRVELPERPGWRERAAALGFGFHAMYGEPYWEDGAAYLFTLDRVERDIEAPTAALHALCLDLVAEAVREPALMTALGVPGGAHELLAASWEAGDPTLYGRFDLAYDGRGPARLLEYNADTPTGVFETAHFQHEWLVERCENGWLPPDADQFNSLQEGLTEAFAGMVRAAPFPTMHLACDTRSEEDAGTVGYLADCAAQAGWRTRALDIAALGIDASGGFVDDADAPVGRCFKLYPWEDMLREPFARHVRPGTFIEPPWKALLSTKAILPLLWERHEGHPNLLPAYFEDDPRVAAMGRHVLKPIHGREGGNVAIVEGGRTTESTGGDYADGPRIAQALAPLWLTGAEAGSGTGDGAGDDARHAVIGSWIAGDAPRGMGVREDRGRITRDLSRFVPHAIVDDPEAVAAALAGRVRR